MPWVPSRPVRTGDGGGRASEMPPRKRFGTIRKKPDIRLAVPGIKGQTEFRRELRFSFRGRVGAPLRTDDRSAQVRGRTPRVRLRSLDAGFFDLVEEGLVADAENDRRLTAIPMDLAQRVGDDGPLRVERGLACDVRQPSPLLAWGRRR